jgi:hypothetical protein
VREYFTVESDVMFRLACGSSVPDEDAARFDAIAEGFELIG